MQAHCEVHRETFHTVSPSVKGCVTCQRYHPRRNPICRQQLLIEQDSLFDRELSNQAR